MTLTLKRVGWLFAAFAMFVALAISPALAAGFLTTEDPFITLDPGVPSGSSVKAILTVGETVDGTWFEGLPDGIGVKPGDAPDTVEVYVAHELTPPQHLPHESLFALDGQVEVEYVGDHVAGEQAMEIHQRGDPGMEQGPATRRHRILEGAEPGHGLGPCPAP